MFSFDIMKTSKKCSFFNFCITFILRVFDVTSVHKCSRSVSRLFLVIEYVNGGDLMFHMQRQRKLPEEHAR